MADRDRASRVALRLGRRDPDWGGSCASWRAALDLEPSLPNPGSVRAHRSCSTRADRAGASCACSRISTVGPYARGGRAAIGTAAQAPRPSSRRKLLTDFGTRTARSLRVQRARGEAASSALDPRTRRWTIHGEQRSSIASSTARFAPTTLSHRSRCGTRVSTQRDRLTTSRSSPRLFRLPRPLSAAY